MLLLPELDLAHDDMAELFGTETAVPAERPPVPQVFRVLQDMLRLTTLVT